MDAEIRGQLEHLVAIYVVDDLGEGHEISMDERDGSVADHSTDACPADLEARTPAETEWLRQVQHYARHFFGERTACEPFPPRDRPDRIAATRAAVEALEPDAFAELFGAYRAQIASHFDAADRPYPLPEGAGDDVLYRLDVYLDGTRAGIEGVSGVEAVHWTPYDERRTVRFGDGDGSDPTPDEEAETELGPETGRPPDARLELGPADLSGDRVADAKRFQGTVTRHLACQIRDYHVGMGAGPPEEYRVTGPGKRAFTSRYRTLDVYADYHDPDADPFGD